MADGKRFAVDLRVVDRLRFRAVILDLFPEQLAYPGHIGPVPAQERSGLEGPDARLVLEIVGVDDNACIHGVRLRSADPDIVRNVLDDLGDHLAGAGSVGLHVGELRIPDGIGALAVMVQDDHRLCRLKKPRRLDNARTVRVHHDQDRGVVQHLQGLGLADEKVLRVLAAAEPVHHRRYGIVGAGNHDMSLLVHAHGDPPDADGCAQGVDIHQAVPHDKQAVLGLDQLPEGVRLDTGLDTGRLLLGVRLAAVVLDVFMVLDHGLVAASSEGKLHGLACELIALHVILAAVADTYGEGDAHLVSDADGLDLFQQIEVVLLQGLKVLPLDDKEVLVLFKLADDGIHPVKVPHDLPVDHGRQKGSPDLVHALHGFLVVVQIDQACHKAHAGVLLLQHAELRLVIKVDGEDPVRGLAGAGNADPEAGFIQLQMVVLALPDTVHLIKAELREQLREPFGVLLPFPEQVLHGFVHPRDAAGSVHKSIGHIQIVRKPLLKLVRRHRPADHGFLDILTSHQEEMSAKACRDQREERRDSAGPAVHAGNTEYRSDPQDCRDQRPSQICAQELLCFFLFLHDLSTSEQIRISPAVRRSFCRAET